MRLLVVANLPPFVLGGAENQTARLVEAWSDLGHHVEVFGHRIPDGEVPLGRHRVRTHRIRVVEGCGRIGRALSYFLSLTRLLVRQKTQFDVIYTRGLADAAVSVCILKQLRLLNLPLVACPISAKENGDAAFLRSIPGWRRIVSLINRHCDAINIIAPAIEPDLCNLGIEGPRIARIPNGIAIETPITRKTTPRWKRLIFVGRLSHQKGLELLIQALRQLCEEGFEFHCQIVGDGPEHDTLKMGIEQAGMISSIMLVGSLPREVVRSYLAKADLFVMPSRYEGMSNAVLEAMESGLPVVVTRCGGIDQYVDQNVGWVCAPDNLEELTDAVRDALLAAPDTMTNMGQMARSLVMSKFRIDKVAALNAELLEQVSYLHHKRCSTG